MFCARHAGALDIALSRLQNPPPYSIRLARSTGIRTRRFPGLSIAVRTDACDDAQQRIPVTLANRSALMRRTLRLVAAVGFIALFVRPTAAQIAAGAIAGTVTASADATPIVGATVTVYDANRSIVG